MPGHEPFNQFGSDWAQPLSLDGFVFLLTAFFCLFKYLPYIFSYSDWGQSLVSLRIILEWDCPPQSLLEMGISSKALGLRFSPSHLGLSDRERFHVKFSFSFIWGDSCCRLMESYSRTHATHSQKSAWATQIQSESIYTMLRVLHT